MIDRWISVPYGHVSRDYDCANCGNRYYLFGKETIIECLAAITKGEKVEVPWPDPKTWHCPFCVELKRLTAAAVTAVELGEPHNGYRRHGNLRRRRLGCWR